MRIAVIGRPGTGAATVCAALRRRGVEVARAGDPCDVVVVVVAEFVKSEDIAVLRAADGPALVVLTKSDLAGRHPDGPMTVARRRAAAIELATGCQTVPMVGLLAVLDAATLDTDLTDALRAFITAPPNLASVDAFVDDPHPVSREVRVRLLERLDRFGVAHAVVALAAGVDAADLPERLRLLSNVDEVMGELGVAATRVRYHRVREAIAEVRSLAVQLDSDQLAALVADDETVLAAMAAAVAVVEADGLSVHRGDTAAAHLERAVRWRRYGRGPVNALHGACGADIVRGSLRLFAATGESSR